MRGLERQINKGWLDNGYEKTAKPRNQITRHAVFYLSKRQALSKNKEYQG